MFLKLDPVQIAGMRVCMCVCPHLSLSITSGMMWCEIDLIRLVNQVYNCYIATILVVINGCGLGIGCIVSIIPLRVS